MVGIALVRPGALGDAVLSLPAVRTILRWRHSAERAGHRRGAHNADTSSVGNEGRSRGGDSGPGILILGTRPSWAFLPPQDAAVRVLDVGAPEWLGLFAHDVALSDFARSSLAGVETAVVYLRPDRTATEAALRAAGVRRIIGADPPTLERAAESDASPPLHAAWRLLAPLAELVGAEACARAWAEELRGAPCVPWWDTTPEEQAAAWARVESTRGGMSCSHKRKVSGSPSVLALHPGSGGRKKRWPAERFAQLAAQAHRTLGLEPLVFFGPADEEARVEFEAALPPGLPLWRAAHRPLREVLALLTCARAYVGNDSGLTHLAARVCRTLALFGPTDPRIWAPLGPRVTVLRAPGPGHALTDLSCDAVWAALRGMV